MNIVDISNKIIAAGGYSNAGGDNWNDYFVNKTNIEPIHLLEKMYQLAYTLFDKIMQVMEFPHVTDTAATSPKGWTALWKIAEVAFNAMVSFSLPLAIIFFIVAIYKSMLSSPPEEQAGHFIRDSIRFAIIIVVAANLFDILPLIVQITDGVTDAIHAKAPIGNYTAYKFDFESSPIKAAIDNYNNNPVSIKTFTQGHALKFFDSIFEYIALFLGGLATIVIFAASALAIINACIQRIVKPLLLIPFATIIISIGACSGEGERMLWRYAKNVLAYSLSGVFIIIALRFGAEFAKVDYIHLGERRSGSTIAALMGVIQVNLPILMTVGLVKSSEGFMSKLFA